MTTVTPDSSAAVPSRANASDLLWVRIIRDSGDTGVTVKAIQNSTAPSENDWDNATACFTSESGFSQSVNGGLLGFSGSDGCSIGDLKVQTLAGATELEEDFALNGSGYAEIQPAYDPAGNLTFDGSYSYVYDAWNRMVEAKRGTGSTTIAQMKYDGLGRRIVKTITNFPGHNRTQEYFYNGQSVIEERNNNEFKVTRQYVWGTQYVDQLIQIGVNTDPHAGQLHENDCETFYWTLTDANYNVLGVVDSSGHLKERYEYTPYGERTVYVNSGSGDARCTAPVLEPPRLVSADSITEGYGLCDFGFQGLMYDEELGIYYNRARYAHPLFGMMSRDPIGYADGMNLYEYLKSNPTINFDPKGEGIEVIYPWNVAATAVRGARRVDTFGGQVINYGITGNWVQEDSALGYFFAYKVGETQGILNEFNGVQNAFIDMGNVGPGAWNWTVGWVTNAQCPYMRQFEWSPGLVMYEPEWVHSWSEGLGGNGGATLLTLGAGQYAQVPRYWQHARNLGGLLLAGRGIYRGGEQVYEGYEQVEGGDNWGYGRMGIGALESLLNVYGGTRIGRSYLPTSKPVVAPRSYASLPSQASGEAQSAAQVARLREFYRQAENYGAGGVKQLENGRFRFYGEVRPARTPGEMMGQRMVREWDPANGAKRTWMETLDQSGNVRIVHPKYDGLPHYLFDAEGNYVGTR